MVNVKHQPGCAAGLRTNNKCSCRPLVLPFVHSNGTSREELHAERAVTAAALRTALEQLREMAPNKRDYYLDQTDETWRLALEQHKRRVKSIEDIIAEIDAEQELLLPDDERN